MERRSRLEDNKGGFGYLAFATIIAQSIVSFIVGIIYAIVLVSLKDSTASFMGFQGEELAMLILLIAIIPAELIVFIVYCRTLKDIFGETIDVIFNIYSLILSLAIGVITAVFIYPQLFPVSVDELTGGVTAETVRVFLFLISPVLVAILSVASQYVYAFNIYTRIPLDWLFALLFILGSVAVFTLLMYIMHWLVIVAGSVVGLVGVICAILSAPTIYVIIIKN